MRSIMVAIGERFHPLFHLRKYRAYQYLSRWLDVPFGTHAQPIKHAVFVSFSKDLALILSRGQYGELAERKNFSTLITSGKFQRFLDIGANIGIYGFTFKALVESGDVTLIEPDSRNAKLLSKTISAGALQQVRVIEAAVSDAQGVATFYLDDLTGRTGSIAIAGESSFVFRHHQHEPRSVTVNCITLDDLYPAGADDPDLIKIDAEGAEQAIFQGGQKLLNRSHPALIFECDGNRPLVTSTLSRLGYIFFDFSTMRRLENVTHNTLALHPDLHAYLVEAIKLDQFHNEKAPPAKTNADG